MAASTTTGGVWVTNLTLGTRCLIVNNPGTVHDEHVTTSHALHGIGMVVPYDFGLDHELWRWIPPTVTIHLTRTPYQDLPVGLAQAEVVGAPSVIAAAARALAHVEPDVIGYGCTSGSFIRGRTGEREIVAALEAAGAPAGVTTSGALVQALDRLGLHRPAVATPYDDATGRALADFLEAAGFTVSGVCNLGLAGRIWTVPQRRTAELVRAAASTGCDAVVVSCTNLATFDVIAALEAELGIPVITANQVTMWACLLVTGQSAPANGQRLFAARSTPAAAGGRR